MSNVDTSKDEPIRCVLEEDATLQILPSIAELGIVNLVAEQGSQTVVLALDLDAVEELHSRLDELLDEGKLRDWEDDDD